MGCICSFFKTLTSYHGSHLTAHQLSRQRQQRARKQRPATPPLTPEKDTSGPPPFAAPALRVPGKGAPTEEDRLLKFSPPKQKLIECKQSSFSQTKFGSSFSKP